MSLDVNLSEPDEFNCFELHSAIKKVSDIVGINNCKYHVDYLNDYGYIANIFRVILTEDGSDKNVSVIVKTLINTARKELFRELHYREVKAYVNVIEEFQLLQNEIESENRIVLPKCLYYCNDKGNEVLILEDLLVDGYEVNETLSMNIKLNFLQVSSIISELAKFHGLTYVFASKRSDFDEISKDFHDILFQESFLGKSKLKNYFVESFDMSLNVIDNMDIKEQLESLRPKLLRLLQMFLEPKKYSVFCHGDFWINNILFKEQVSFDKT
ncbi:uncharacterized protein LOC126968168 [Leptidea sinapis]|uniref:uncharacterized protein LOC126968168 n=1 Tax=Leptidea sinapis TaxID=189913 RepID=UPI0021C4ADCE|nr:uncharacterized protein LOC126968168 [Leptidea sinapis]